MTRRGFTLIELLIVVSVIAVLASLLLPAVSMVRAQANKLKCANNMRNLAVGIMAYRSDNNDGFPGCFAEICAGYAVTPKLLLCPVDATHGRDPNMGRYPVVTGGWGDYSRLFYMQLPGTPFSSPSPAMTSAPISACSYDYECSGWIDPSGQLFTGGSNSSSGDGTDMGFFYQELPAGQKPAEGSVSWAMGKLHEQQFGNLSAPGTYGEPFPASTVPMTRCYHHYAWTGKNSDNSQAKVVNISLEGNLIYTIPYWEQGYNPNIQ